MVVAAVGLGKAGKDGRNGEVRKALGRQVQRVEFKRRWLKEVPPFWVRRNPDANCQKSHEETCVEDT